MQNAEAALKRAKDMGEQYLHYKLEMHSEVAERLALEIRLRDAVDAKQFVLHYQPQVNIATGRVESVEALLRWNDPERGLIPPAQFLPTARILGIDSGSGRVGAAPGCAGQSPLGRDGPSAIARGRERVAAAAASPWIC